MIPKEKLTELLEKLSLSEYVASKINLDKKGRNYWGICPFHEDTTPSLAINNEKGIFTCFVCKETGNAINFEQKYSSSNFVDAVKTIASFSNFEIEELANFKSRPKYSDKQEKLFELNDIVCRYFKVMLNQNSKMGQEATQYLDKRDIDFELREKWEVGLFPKANTDQLFKVLIENYGFSNDQLLESGIAYISQSGQMRCYFDDRIIFPIKNSEGNIVGFSGRVLDDSKPKYLNTPETSIFKKHQILFNSQNVLNKPLLSKEVIVLEGFMDVIALDRIGIENVVATMGTTLSTNHLDQFAKKKSTLKLFFDGDRAGVNATFKNAKEIIKYGLDFSIITNETGLDPDELVKKDPNHLKELIKTNDDIVDFAVQKLDIKSYNFSQIDKFMNLMSSIVNDYHQDWKKEFFVNKISKETSISINSIKPLINFIPIKDSQIELENIDLKHKLETLTSKESELEYE